MNRMGFVVRLRYGLDTWWIHVFHCTIVGTKVFRRTPKQRDDDDEGMSTQVAVARVVMEPCFKHVPFRIQIYSITNSILRRKHGTIGTIKCLCYITILALYVFGTLGVWHDVETIFVRWTGHHCTRNGSRLVDCGGGSVVVVGGGGTGSIETGRHGSRWTLHWLTRNRRLPITVSSHWIEDGTIPTR